VLFLRFHVLYLSNVKPSLTEASVLCKVLGNLTTIFMKLVLVFLA
jgi:hypothetical protein